MLHLNRRGYIQLASSLDELNKALQSKLQFQGMLILKIQYLINLTKYNDSCSNYL